jgi:hypothetical protein
VPRLLTTGSSAKKRTPAIVPRLHQSTLYVPCVTDSLSIFPEGVNNQRRKYGSKAEDTLSSRHVSSRDVTSAVGIFNIEFWRTLTLMSLCLRRVI